MKFHPTSLLSLAFVAIIFVGCEPQSSTPLAVAPTTKTTTKLVPKQEDPFWREEMNKRPLTDPLVRASVTETAAAPAEPKPAAAASTRPKADREPTRPGDPEKISFDDLNLGMQADMVYRPFMLTDRAKELEGKQIRLSGEMYGGVLGREKLKEFVILRNRECKYGPGGQADHVAQVKMKDGITAKFTAGTIRVEGTLRINPVNDEKDGNTKHVFVLEDAVVK